MLSRRGCGRVRSIQHSGRPAAGPRRSSRQLRSSRPAWPRGSRPDRTSALALAVDAPHARGFPARPALGGQARANFVGSSGSSSSSSSTTSLAAHDAQRQRQGENHARLGIEALGASGRGVGAAEHALEAAHQIVMADQTEVAALAESDSEPCREPCVARPRIGSTRQDGGTS